MVAVVPRNALLKVAFLLDFRLQISSKYVFHQTMNNIRLNHRHHQYRGCLHPNFPPPQLANRKWTIPSLSRTQRPGSRLTLDDIIFFVPRHYIAHGVDSMLPQLPNGQAACGYGGTCVALLRTPSEDIHCCDNLLDSGSEDSSGTICFYCEGRELLRTSVCDGAGEVLDLPAEMSGGMGQEYKALIARFVDLAWGV